MPVTLQLGLIFDFRLSFHKQFLVLLIDIDPQLEESEVRVKELSDNLTGFVDEEEVDKGVVHRHRVEANGSS